MHLQGKPHLKKVEHALMEESKFNWCPICSVQLSSLKQAFSHCMSKQHCEKLLKQQGVDFGPKRKVINFFFVPHSDPTWASFFHRLGVSWGHLQALFRAPKDLTEIF